jgi:hypothetical protein
MNHRLMVVASLAFILGATQADDLERDPILYSKSEPNNVVTALIERVKKGSSRLEYRADDGFLRCLLSELNIPLSSQVLVFSKTSLQRGRISPKTPRAIYFNDDVYLGYCLHGTVMEISVADARLGTVFYTIDQERASRPNILRQTDSCLVCHASSYNHGLPGHLIRSVYPDPHGEPLLASGSYRTDQTSKFSERWGGWYVTGTHGQQKHLGNQCYNKGGEPTDNAIPTQNVTDLSQHFTVGLYPSPHSDLVALMVLEHQAIMHNRLTRALLDTRQALHYQEDLNKAFSENAGTLFDSTRRRIDSVADEVVKYLLFSQEAKLTEPIAGTSSFAQEFSQRGPFDKQGRSLRQLDLRTRLFKYPCSYLIYSKSFDALPTQIRERILDKLLAVLDGKNTSTVFQHLTASDRQVIKEILVETKPSLPASWRTSETRP